MRKKRNNDKYSHHQDSIKVW